MKHRLPQFSIFMGNTVIEVNKAWSFSAMSVDNINVDIQSSLSTTSLHGTVASINQHPTRNNEGQTGQRICLNKGVSKLKQLPDWYTEAPSYHLPNDTLVPICSKPSITDVLKSFVLLEDET